MGIGNVGRRIVSGVASAGAVILIARASALPLTSPGADSSRLRLSWTARPDRIEHCRAIPDEELQRRPEHMRQRVACEGAFATYELRVEADNQLLHRQVVHGAGMRHDRPLYLLREIQVAPGTHRVRVTFMRNEQPDSGAISVTPDAHARADSGIFAGRAQRETAERTRRARAAIPPRLELDTTVTFEKGRVAVITFDPDSRRFRVLAEPIPGK